MGANVSNFDCGNSNTIFKANLIYITATAASPFYDFNSISPSFPISVALVLHVASITELISLAFAPFQTH